MSRYGSRHLKSSIRETHLDEEKLHIKIHFTRVISACFDIRRSSFIQAITGLGYIHLSSTQSK